MLKRMQQGGEDELPVLRDFAMRSGLADIADFVNVYEICRASGGDLARAMNRAATIIGDKIQLEAELKTMMAQKAFERPDRCGGAVCHGAADACDHARLSAGDV